MDDVMDFIFKFDGKQREVLLHFHKMILNNPGIYAKKSFGIPFYYGKSWICYLNPTKDNGVEFSFTRGNELSNTQGLLQPRGRKQVSSITYHDIKQIEESTILEILHEAILLDEKVAYKTNKKEL